MSPVLLAFAASFVAGALVFAVAFHQRRSIAHWLFILGMGLLALERCCAALAADSASVPALVDWLNRSLLSSGLLPSVWVAFSLVYARGDAWTFLRRWKWMLLILACAPLAAFLVAGGSFLQFVRLNGDPPETALVLRLPGKFIHLTILVGSVLMLMNLERTFRASVGTIRWRIKFMVLGLGVLFATYTYMSSQALLFATYPTTLQPLSSGALLVACALVFRTLMRPGHFEVNVYPSQSLIHNSLSILLAGVYLMLIGILAKVVSITGWTAAFHTKALIVLVALVVITILVMSDRVRLHTRRFISRYFQRPLYDYRTVWRTFAESTARCLEEKQLCESVAKLISEVFQALSVTIWLVDEKRENLVFTASTSASPGNAGERKLGPADARELIKVLSARPEPVDLDASREFWASALRRAHPDEFKKGGNRVCVPMIAGGELLGIIAVGDRVGGITFSIQDMDLLKSASDQAAASLLNIQLAQKLSQAKQLEAFQAMSAFFVHDLKNTASTLSLMLQNLPVHYNDPKFREDALRGIAKTVSHINDLVGRLSVLRHELAIHPVDADMNEIVADGLKAHEVAQDVEIRKELGTVAKVKVDCNQIQKVLTNLVINAKEAIQNGGYISVRTSTRDGWAVLAVDDNGCGMTPEFVQSRLFKPFQTTKKKGIGIGMFHCKMIVEAHRGRIEVESSPGKGSSFKVLLPLAT